MLKDGAADDSWLLALELGRILSLRLWPAANARGRAQRPQLG